MMTNANELTIAAARDALRAMFIPLIEERRREPREDMLTTLAQHEGEDHASRDIRKHIGWYLRGFPVGGQVRAGLAKVDSLDALRELLAPWADSDALAADADGARGRQGSPSKVALPDGWLDDPEDECVPVAADIMNSGG